MEEEASFEAGQNAEFGSVVSPVRSCLSLCIQRLARGLDLHLSSACEMSQMEYGRTGNFLLYVGVTVFSGGVRCCGETREQSTQLEEVDIDFRVPGLSHEVVKEAEHFRVQELVKNIENHRHREALQADLQQNNVYNPFSKDSQEMIRELGNVELFEVCETAPKVQCSHCPLYWKVNCTCGKCLIDSEASGKFLQTDWMHSLSRTPW